MGRSARRSPGGGAHTWDARRGGRAEEQRLSPPLCVARPGQGWKPEAGAGERLGTQPRGDPWGAPSLRPQPGRGPSARSRGHGGSAPLGARVSPGPPPGHVALLFLLLLRPPGLGLASLRLLDHPAPVCSQEVRSDPSGWKWGGGRSGGCGASPGCCGQATAGGRGWSSGGFRGF